ncbi:glycosyltransferase family 2 protein [Actinoplanes nipponensis]|uniref:glycosyltransferase family 2 protein n=1 Tax=Actinoplanes nipponensis TaxID=135950 RepID=UPI001942A282|nr:glycosyltransferase family 2 protein [Actinoplanes nipponensis]
MSADPAASSAPVAAVATALTAPQTSASVVICCYTQQRWADLTDACAAVRDQVRPGDEVIVVVDHNDALLARARQELDGVRVLANQGVRGLSEARNTGVRASAGDIVVFLDDDAVPRAGWLERVRHAFTERHVVVVGTSVAPRWEGGAAPGWFPAEFGWVVGCSYRGLPTRRSPIRNPIGASMAVRRSVFAAVGGFSDAVGRVGALPVGCEETEFCIRAASRRPESRVVLEPDAYVDHFVPVARQTLSYFVRRCYHEGRSKRAVARLTTTQAALAAERRYVRAVLPAGVLRGIGGSVRHPRKFLQAGAIVVGLSATVTGYLSPRRPPPRPQPGAGPLGTDTPRGL